MYNRVSVIESGSNFIKYSNGLLIQWGSVASISKEGNNVVNIQSYGNTNYSVFANIVRNGSSGSGVNVVYVYKNSSSQIRLQRDYASTGDTIPVTWCTIGMRSV